METSDNSLAQAAADGDRAAFATLLNRQYDRLFRLCFRLTGAQAEAEDLTQDICAALPAKLRSYRGEAAFTTWLYRIAVNAAHDRRRKLASHARAADGWGGWEVNRLAANTEAAEKSDWLTTAMRTLPQDLRDTLALVLDDMTHKQASEVLNVSEGTISWRISEAKKAPQDPAYGGRAMSDDLNDLKQLMYGATPDPDPDRKAENIALAQKNFDARQGTANGLRPTSDRPTGGVFSGVVHMFSNLVSSRAGLTASTALVAVGLVMLTPLGDNLRLPDGLETRSQSKPEVTPAVLPEPTSEAAAVVDDSEIVQEEYVIVEPDLSVQPAAPVVATRSRKAISGLALDQNAPIALPESNAETFANTPANPVQITSETPVSTFSIDVDTASYAVIRRMLTSGQLPPRDAVRIEEMVNYFTYDYAAPAPGTAFQPTISVMQTPWNPDTQLLHIALQGDMPAVTDRPPLNLVFLIDTSGSMNSPDKLPLLKQSFRLMLSQLRPEDEIAIVTYAGSAGEILAPTKASERSTILAALDLLDAGGSTAGQAGLQQAYATADAMAKDGEVSRVILATDGDFNVGLSDPQALESFIADKRDSGTYLSVLGFGRGNLDDATMQALAQSGNGQAAYIDTLAEAQKVLVDQLTGALFPIANDVKIQVEFNPATVSEYRLIGYETRALRREDFNNDRVDAGDIGAGHQVTALYELTPTGSPAQLSDPLRYGTADNPATQSDELAFLRLRYKTPGAPDSALIETPVSASQSAPASFAAAIAGFGQLLRSGTYLGDWTYTDAIALATATKGTDPYGSRAEAIQLMRLAQSLSTQ